MGKNTQIEWADHTFNPWWGCVKVSSGCKFCYAQSFDKRLGGQHWGPDSVRRKMSEEYWRQPFKWNKEAQKNSTRYRVFCASMADVFESHPDTNIYRNRLFKLIKSTPYLIWMILTKRPENIEKLAPRLWMKHGFPENVWIGTTIEDQQAADIRMPIITKIKAKVKFLSCEPLISAVDFTPPEYRGSVLNKNSWLQEIDWVIIGGESGVNARPMHPVWAINIINACVNRTDMGRPWPLPVFFKQWGEWQRGSQVKNHKYIGKHICIFENGDFFDYHDADQYKKYTKKYGYAWNDMLAEVMSKTGKSVSGAEIDGKEYKQIPI